jgi:putative membrane protein
MLRWLLASLHLLALGLGLGAVWARAIALRGPLDASGLRRVFAADSWWGLAGLLWIVTGLWRLLAGTEKPTHYYMDNHFFYLKMAALLVLLLLEARAVILLMGWRRATGRGGPVDTAAAPGLARISYVQVALVLVMLAAATAMARGMGGGS